MSTELITEHLDLWTSAVTYNNGKGRGNNGESELTGIQKLRELILELAVRGKLVPQDPEDEPASKLLERIEEEKKRLYKEGKIKKPKKLPEIGESEKSFEVPEGWEIVRLGEIINLVSGHHLKSDQYSKQALEGSLPYITGPADFGGKNPIPSRYTCNSKAIAEPGDILLTCKGSGVGSLNWAVETVAISRQLMAIKGICVESRWLFYVLANLREEIRSQVVGIAIPGISREDILHAMIMVPPLPEQLRIVERADELLALCDRLEQQTSDQISAHETLVDTLLDTLIRSRDAAELAENWARLAEHFDTLFTTEHSIDRLEQTILQLAVMGRLVPQDLNDEPASKLLERIEGEKARLYKEGKIKRPKKLPEIEESEKSFKVPKGWQIVRLGEVINLVSGHHLKSDQYSKQALEGTLPYITGPADFGEKNPIPSRYTCNSKAIAKPGDILLTCKGSGVGSLNWAVETVAISRQLMAIQGICVDGRWLFYVLANLRQEIRGKVVGIAIPGISREDILHALVMVPPLPEQKRIVERADKLMGLCDRLRTNLNEASETRVSLAESIVKQAVA